MDNQEFENNNTEKDSSDLSFLWDDETESSSVKEHNVFDDVFGERPDAAYYPGVNKSEKTEELSSKKDDGSSVKNRKKNSSIKKSGGKKKNVKKGRIAYMIFVLILLAAIVLGFIWVWNQCREYQAGSAATLVGRAEKELEEKTGLDLESSLIPTISDNNEYIYVLKADKKPVAAVTLNKVKSGIMGLALFEEKSVDSLVNYTVVIPSDCELSVEGQSSDYARRAQKFSFPVFDTLKNLGHNIGNFVSADVNWIYDISQVSVSRKDRQLSMVEIAENTYLAAPFYTGKVCETLRERAAELSHKYAMFMSNDYSYWDLDPYIISGSPLVDSLSNMDMTWFGYHESTQVADLKVSDPMIIGDRYALINTSFNYNIYRWGETDVSPIELSLILYLCDDGYWRLADMTTYIDIDLGLSDQIPWISPYSTPNGKYPYFIRVNRSLNCVTVYRQDEYGDYSIPVKAMVCSTGREGNETPVYDYSMEWRAPWCYMVDGSYGRYAINLRSDGYMFHTICYYSQDNNRMMADEYNLLGEYASLGCIRLQTIDALWIYDNCVDGTGAEVYEDPSSPGPLGKPSREVDYISGETGDGWDPTDPSPYNPWRTILN